MEEFLSLKKMLVTGWVYLACLVLGSWVFSSWSFAWAVAAGGVVSLTSFWFSYRDVVVFFERLSPAAAGEQPAEATQVKETKKGFIVKFWLRIFVIGVILLLLITIGTVNVFGLILGLTTVVFTITISALSVVWKYYFGRR